MFNLMEYEMISSAFLNAWIFKCMDLSCDYISVIWGRRRRNDYRLI